jgi:hypothetical protein
MPKKLSLFSTYRDESRKAHRYTSITEAQNLRHSLFVSIRYCIYANIMIL